MSTRNVILLIAAVILLPGIVFLLNRSHGEGSRGTGLSPKSTEPYLLSIDGYTHSMSPRFKVGDVLKFTPDWDNVSMNAVIDFDDKTHNGRTVHSVVKITRDSFGHPLYLQTKGDHNNKPDPFLVDEEHYHGTYVETMPTKANPNP